MSKVNIYIYFENPICRIFSVADGQDLNDLIYFDESKDDIRSFYWKAVPRTGVEGKEDKVGQSLILEWELNTTSKVPQSAPCPAMSNVLLPEVERIGEDCPTLSNPNEAETVCLYSDYGIHPFTVVAVHHECHGHGHPQYVKVLLRQMTLSEYKSKWFI